METIIKIEDLTVSYHEKPVLWDIDLSIEKGKLTAIVGPNGAGKSTLLKAILGLLKLSSGSILLNGEKITNNKKQISYVPQTGSVDWDFPINVEDVVLMGTYGELGWFKRVGKTQIEKTKKALESVQMTDFKDRQISKLSGGQQQRVFLARALVQDANVYFLDEPLKGVDAKSEKTIMNILFELRNQGKTIIIVHHDLRTVPSYFDNVVLLNKRVISSGTVSEAFTEENIEKAYFNGADDEYNY